MNKEEYEFIKEKYIDGEITFSIDLAKARKVTTVAQGNPIAGLTITIHLLCIFCCIASFFILKWFGVLYSIIFANIVFSCFGIFSLPKEQSNAKTIFMVGSISVAVSLLLSQYDVAILLFYSVLTLYLIYYLYQLSAKIFIKKFILANIENFNAFYGDVFYIKEQ